MKFVENAKLFFEACEGAKGWAACTAYVVPDAPFTSQSRSCDGVHTVQQYCDNLAEAINGIFPGASYELDAVTCNEQTRQVIMFGTSIVRHTGNNGPVAPTNKEARVQFAYVFEMDASDRITHMTKVFDTDTGLQQLGWPAH